MILLNLERIGEIYVTTWQWRHYIYKRYISKKAEAIQEWKKDSQQPVLPVNSWAFYAEHNAKIDARPWWIRRGAVAAPVVAWYRPKNLESTENS